MPKPIVSIVMGSDSDLPLMEETSLILKEFNISHELVISSAHRSPIRTQKYANGLTGRGIKIVIAGAGGSAHLAGVIAAHTTIPVIGVPVPSPHLNGMDSLLSTVQMPSGIPVATVGIGKAGAKNAGLLAIEILALMSPQLSKKMLRYRENLEKGVEIKAKKLSKKNLGL